MLKTLGNLWCGIWAVIGAWAVASWVQIAFDISMADATYNFFVVLANLCEYFA